MKCPCLRETSVHSCSAAAVRKMISTQALWAGEKCISNYSDCPVYAAADSGLGQGTCPYLLESVVQYCAAAASPQYVPWSEHSFSRCGASGHRYCELYLRMAGNSRGFESVDGIAISPKLKYTRNHFWFDEDDDGWWHAGIDGMLARALGRADAITFIPMKTVTCPSVVVTVGGNDLTLTVPHKVRVTGLNSWLRADPARLTRDPYSHGWLFEGVGGVPEGLLEGDAARRWMASETDHASRVLHSFLGGHPADGGVFAEGVLRELDRERALRFFLEMFSPLGGDL